VIRLTAVGFARGAPRFRRCYRRDSPATSAGLSQGALPHAQQCLTLYREHDLAIDCYERAIRLFQDIGDRDSEGIVRDHLGDARAGAGDPRRAAEAWRRAADLLDHLGSPGAAAVRLSSKHPACRCAVEAYAIAIMDVGRGPFHV
jgi:tetratricopeptide (TPR) repeat protein